MGVSSISLSGSLIALLVAWQEVLSCLNPWCSAPFYYTTLYFSFVLLSLFLCPFVFFNCKMTKKWEKVTTPRLEVSPLIFRYLPLLLRYTCMPRQSKPTMINARFLIVNGSNNRQGFWEIYFLNRLIKP